MPIRTLLFGPATILLALAIVAGAVVYFGSEEKPVQAADHRDSITPSMDPYADINDVYVFNDRGTQFANNRVCLVMTVNPHARGLAPTHAFSENVAYNFHADVNGDAKADATITFRFTYPAPGVGGPGSFTISGLSNNKTFLTGFQDANVVIPTGTNGSVGTTDVFCGFREDPFFFDLVGFRQFLAGTYNYVGGSSGLRNGGSAVDTFVGQNVGAIVLEVSDDVFGGPTATFTAWASTSR
jgi:hypothetical protein